MTIRTTQANIKNSHPIVVGVEFCALQHLLRPCHITANVYGKSGWVCSLYSLTNKVAVVTGYSYDKAHNATLPKDVLENFDRRARKCKTADDGQALLNEFVQYALKHAERV